MLILCCAVVWVLLNAEDDQIHVAKHIDVLEFSFPAVNIELSKISLCNNFSRGIKGWPNDCKISLPPLL
jgi:hypothetical protein